MGFFKKKTDQINVKTSACAASMDTIDMIARVVTVFALSTSVMKSYRARIRRPDDSMSGTENI